MMFTPIVKSKTLRMFSRFLTVFAAFTTLVSSHRFQGHCSDLSTSISEFIG